MADTLTFFCLISGNHRASAFKIRIRDPLADVADLKGAIFNKFPNVNAINLVLWKATVPANKSRGEEGVIELGSLDDKTELDPRTRLSKLSVDDNTYIIFKRPKALKRDGEEGAESSFKRQRLESRLDSTTLKRAIASANLTQQAVVKGGVDLSRLNNRQRVTLLGFLGQDLLVTDDFNSLVLAAVELRNVDIGELGEITATGDLKFPIVQAGDLYIRDTYRELYGAIVKTFESGVNRIIVTGTSGIGKSVFLVYLAIRLLAESDTIVIFHTNRGDECYAFGGRWTVRYGKIEDFRPFLTLSETWYLADSSPAPELSKARTVIAASPEILFSESVSYHNIDKNVAWRYYLAPWTLVELTTCRNIVKDFNRVPLHVMDDLYLKIGGVPRYVLARAMQEVIISPDNLESVIERSSERLVRALNNVYDPVMMRQLLARGKDSLEFSSALVHPWPVGDHRDFRLEWASTYVAEKITNLLNQDPASGC
ncbi:hypothetical protein EMPS_05312 [Entomortierella parvispora]|uniref:Crinkler effector protein N-terminal domain-containing protein n=1 Tax=Entomortierella parvispora TaxID=205924 RepID=A0A9P3LWD7_9FUNG|nr:hypothetical protein EMPS_05312 [Entomortierella parvispora]